MRVCVRVSASVYVSGFLYVSGKEKLRECLSVRACMRACAHACVRACVSTHAHTCM